MLFGAFKFPWQPHDCSIILRLWAPSTALSTSLTTNQVKKIFLLWICLSSLNNPHCLAKVCCLSFCCPFPSVLGHSDCTGFKFLLTHVFHLLCLWYLQFPGIFSPNLSARSSSFHMLHTLSTLKSQIMESPFMGDFHYTDVCLKNNTAELKQSRRFLE